MNKEGPRGADRRRQAAGVPALDVRRAAEEATPGCVPASRRGTTESGA